MNNIQDVLKYFYEISKIPRMSGHEEKIADYIENFAKKQKLEYRRDAYNNVIVIKEKSKGCKTNESIILQSHLDMVCEKEENVEHDFLKDGLNVYVDGDYIKARGTTLGADNGIGVAIMLSILASDNIMHPRIETIFTVQEETTMEGAKNIDVDKLTGKKMICLDNMNEEELLIGCADAKIYKYQMKRTEQSVDDRYSLLGLELTGFIGGHSGEDISKPRGNPIKEMGNVLEELYNKYDIYLKSIAGGQKVNVIPRECSTQIYAKNADMEMIKQDIEKYEQDLNNRIIENNNIKLTLEKLENKQNSCYDKDTTENIINLLKDLPNGVNCKDEYGNPLVSLNVGKIESSNDLQILFSTRSNKEKEEKKLEDRLEQIKSKYNITEKTSKLCGYEHKDKSQFVEQCKKIYIDFFKKKPKLVNMHICLEAGFFGEKIPELDFIAIAPNIYDAHSPNERCSISSLGRIYEYILLILKNC